MENNDEKCNQNENDYITSKCLKEKFSLENFRENQLEIISSILNERRDTVAVMTSGHGKSLCYQFPSVLNNTITIIISPLISLIQNQEILLKELNTGIKVCFLQGTSRKTLDIIKEIYNFNLIYITPETLGKLKKETKIMSEFKDKLKEKLSLIAIDEAHCISEWGHEFRPTFRNIKSLKITFPGIPILAVTSTARKEVLDDIISVLQLRDPLIIHNNIYLPNLELNVEKETRDTWFDIGKYIKQEIESLKEGKMIIFCLNKDIVKAIFEQIQTKVENLGFICERYHTDLTNEEREKVLKKFMKGNVNILVASVAFGIGIHIPNMRITINYGAPMSIESYYQEITRAGRDNKDNKLSKCYMFYSNEDWDNHKTTIEKHIGDEQNVKRQKKLSDKMKEYCELFSCRKSFISKYFEDSKFPENCTICDNCSKKHELFKEDTK